MVEPESADGRHGGRADRSRMPSVRTMHRATADRWPSGTCLSGFQQLDFFSLSYCVA